MSLIKKMNPRWFTWTIVLFFAAIYFSISIYNHFNFRSFAFDLGIKNQVIWDYAHGRYNYNTIMPELGGHINVLANHFEPILFLLAPLYYVFGSYTLLWVQIVFILFGGYGLYKYIAEISGDRIFASLGMAMFYAMWGVFGALSFDFHTNVLAAVLVPWLFYAIQRKKHGLWILILVLILLCKENVAIWMVFVGIGIFLHWIRDKKRRNVGLLTAAISAIYFIGVMKYAMPYFADGKLAYLHFKYSALGNNWTEALHTVFTKPGYTFRLLFESHTSGGDLAFNENAKWQLHVFVFLSGGVFLLLRPQFLVMLIPIYAQKMFSDDPVKWSIFQQYSIEFVPIIVLAAFCFINQSKNPTVKILAGILVFLASFDATKEFSGLWKPMPYGKYMTNFYQPSHYKREFENKEMYELMKALPKKASVSASFYVLPHIANRKTIYQFPEIKDADFVLVVDDGVCYYPLENASYRQRVDSLLQSGSWGVELKTNHGYLLKRKE
jgi:uncharacterized membrane protein